MTDRHLQVIINSDLVPSKEDMLHTDCLRIETISKLNLIPGKEIRINLSVHNSSNVGRMANITTNFDARNIKVNIPNSNIYVGPEGKTIVYAIVTPLASEGYSNIFFDVF